MITFVCVAVGGLLLVWGVPRLWLIIEQALKRG